MVQLGILIVFFRPGNRNTAPNNEGIPMFSIHRSTLDKMITLTLTPKLDKIKIDISIRANTANPAGKGIPDCNRKMMAIWKSKPTP